MITGNAYQIDNAFVFKKGVVFYKHKQVFN